MDIRYAQVDIQQVDTVTQATGARLRVKQATLAAAILVWPLAAAMMAAGSRFTSAADDTAVAVAASASRGVVTGRLEGRVVLGPRLTSRRMRFSAYPDARQAATSRQTSGSSRGKPADQPAGEFGNVVVYLESVPGLEGRGRPAGGAPVMRQEGEAFSPHVLPVMKGSIVAFPNTDPVFHNVFSLSRAASFDLGRYPRGEAKSVRFDTPGVIKVFCHIHADMSGVVLVLDNPFFATPDAAGEFRIDGIPAGEYRAVAWHERAHPVSLSVRIAPGAATPAEFAIPLEETVD
jgi:plastocyanin